MEKLSPVAKELKEEFSKLLMEGVFQFELVQAKRGTFHKHLSI